MNTARPASHSCWTELTDASRLRSSRRFRIVFTTANLASASPISRREKPLSFLLNTGLGSLTFFLLHSLCLRLLVFIGGGVLHRAGIVLVFYRIHMYTVYVS